MSYCFFFFFSSYFGWILYKLDLPTGFLLYTMVHFTFHRYNLASFQVYCKVIILPVVFYKICALSVPAFLLASWHSLLLLFIYHRYEWLSNYLSLKILITASNRTQQITLFRYLGHPMHIKSIIWMHLLLPHNNTVDKLNPIKSCFSSTSSIAIGKEYVKIGIIDLFTGTFWISDLGIKAENQC